MLIFSWYLVFGAALIVGAAVFFKNLLKDDSAGGAVLAFVYGVAGFLIASVLGFILVGVVLALSGYDD